MIDPELPSKLKAISEIPDADVAELRDIKEEISNIAAALEGGQAQMADLLESVQNSIEELRSAVNSNDPGTVVAAIKGLKFPESKLDNSPVISAIESLYNAINALKLDPKIEVKAPIVEIPEAPAPVVNVPAPVVNIPELDLSPVVKAAESTTNAIENLTFPVPTFPRVDPLARFKPSDKDDAGDPSYFGFADSSGDFYIMEINDALGTFRYYYSGQTGSHSYATDWANRASLTYDYIYNTGII